MEIDVKIDRVFIKTGLSFRKETMPGKSSKILATP